MVNVLAMPVLTGRKTARERFPGAINTLACEAMMGDGKALQMGTSHELGQNFARAFGTQYSTEAGTQEFVWQTSWGVSTRMMGGLIMAHGDEAGLRLPPRIAPVQVVVLVVKADGGAGEAAEALAAELRAAGVRVELDARTDVSFGRRAVDWELKGVPVRIEVGPRDVATGQVTLVRRDTSTKSTEALATVGATIPALLATIQDDLLAAAVERRDARTTDVETLDEAVAATAEGFARIPWSVVAGGDGEAALRAQGVTVRCLRQPDGSLPTTDDDPHTIAVVARAY